MFCDSISLMNITEFMPCQPILCRPLSYRWKTYGELRQELVLVVKNQPASAGNLRDTGSVPGSERFPGEGHGNPLQYSRLENAMDRRAWRATVHRAAKSRTWMKPLSMHAFVDVNSRDSPMQTVSTMTITFCPVHLRLYYPTQDLGTLIVTGISVLSSMVPNSTSISTRKMIKQPLQEIGRSSPYLLWFSLLCLPHTRKIPA